MMFKVILLTLAACELVRTNDLCIKDCNGRDDGDYQSCNGCDVYASCSGGILYNDRPCSGDLVWDDRNKTCEATSKTCPYECIDSCKGRANGDYQSCEGCNVYATCSNGNLNDNRPCAADLSWDDIKKNCEFKSETCTY